MTKDTQKGGDVSGKDLWKQWDRIRGEQEEDAPGWVDHLFQFLELVDVCLERGNLVAIDELLEKIPKLKPPIDDTTLKILQQRLLPAEDQLMFFDSYDEWFRDFAIARCRGRL